MTDLMNLPIKQALLLAAGLGERMRPLTDSRPKPLLEVGGVALIDALYGRLEQAGARDFTVNAYYHAEQIAGHFKARPNCQVLRESERLETGGAVVNALQAGALSDSAFWVTNSDSLWEYDNADSLQAMRDMWDEDSMDVLLMVCPLGRAFGYHGKGDFAFGENSSLVRSRDPNQAQVFCGVQILNAQAFADYKSQKEIEPFSLNRIYDRAIEENRLFGYSHQGDWWHVGTPEDLAETEKHLANR